MSFKTGSTQIDGSINIDGSIFQWQQLFSGGGGGGGTGDVAWGSGNVGSNNQLITALGDGSIAAEPNLTYDLSLFSVNGDVSIGSNIYMTGGKTIYLSGSTGQIKYVSDELNLIGNNIHLNAATNIILEPFMGRVNILSDVSIASDLTVSSDIINPGMPNVSTNYTVYFDTTTKKLSYADAPTGGDVDISTLSIESYVNTSTYYDSSIRYRTMPEPSTGFGSGNGAEGLFVNFKAANTISSYYCGYIDTGGRIALADADASNMMPAVAINTTGSSLSAGTNYNLLIYGVVRNTAWNFAIGQPVYVGLSGEVTTTMPSSAPDCVQVIGRTISPDSIIFNPSPDFVVLK